MYLVSSVIMQKTGSGLHMASSCFWDNQTDGQLQHYFKEESDWFNYLVKNAFVSINKKIISNFDVSP